MNSKCTVVNSETKLLFIAVESLTFWSVKAFTPETKRTVSLILSHKMTFPTKAKMIYVQKKKHLTVAWVCRWIIAPGHAEHSAHDRKYHCFGWVWWETSDPVWIVGKKEGCSCMWREVMWTGRWEPHLVEWTTVKLRSLLSSGRTRGYEEKSGKKKKKRTPEECNKTWN